jgi:hypothetical protein
MSDATAHSHAAVSLARLARLALAAVNGMGVFAGIRAEN